MPLNIRKALPKDLRAIVDFNQAMALETENKTLDDHTLSAGVAGMLDNPHRGFYLVAEDEQGQIAGSLMVTFEWSDWRNATFCWIQSVYVKPEFRRQGVYSGLYAKVQQIVEDSEDICGYRLYVENDNHIAQRTYESLGMKASHYLMYESD